MTITLQNIITFAAAIAAVIALLKYLAKVYDLVKHQKEQDENIKAIKSEQKLLVEAMYSCLDGLGQLGANHTVPAAKQKLYDHLNDQAHQ